MTTTAKMTDQQKERYPRGSWPRGGLIMHTYRCYYRHHSISRSVLVPLCAPTDRAAKAAAWRTLGAGFLGHVVVLDRLLATGDYELVAARVIGERRWHTA